MSMVVMMVVVLVTAVVAGMEVGYRRTEQQAETSDWWRRSPDERAGEDDKAYTTEKLIPI